MTRYYCPGIVSCHYIKTKSFSRWPAEGTQYLWPWPYVTSWDGGCSL